MTLKQLMAMDENEWRKLLRLIEVARVERYLNQPCNEDEDE